MVKEFVINFLSIINSFPPLFDEIYFILIFIKKRYFLKKKKLLINNTTSKVKNCYKNSFIFFIKTSIITKIDLDMIHYI